jgi:hypothetical protein
MTALDKVWTLWSLLKRHKKKTAVGMLFFIIYMVFKYMKHYKKFDFIINKMAERMTKQLEDNLRESEKIQKVIRNMDDIIGHFKDLNGAIRSNLKKDVSYLFSLDQIKESLKNKSLTPTDKKLIWENFKNESLLFTAFSLTYFQISNLILFIKEIIIVKYERMLDGANKDQFIIFENFFTTFCEFLIKDGGKHLFVYLRDALKEVYEPLNLTEKRNPSQICSIFTKMTNILLQPYVPDPNDLPLRIQRMPSRQSSSLILRSQSDLIDYSDMTSFLQCDTSNEKIAKKKQPKTPAQNGLKMPQLDVTFHNKFIKILKDHSVIVDPQFLNKYLESSMEDNLSKSVDSSKATSNNSQSLYASTSGRISGDFSEDKENIIPNNNNVKLDESTTKSQQQEKFLEIFKKAVDEFLDQIDSPNFHLYLRYAIKFEFNKLKNRILKYFLKSKIEEMTIASLVPTLHNIVKEEFLDPESVKNNEAFYYARTKMGVTMMNQEEININMEEADFTIRVIKECERKKYVDNAFFEFGKRIFMEDTYSKFYGAPTTKLESGKNEMQEFMKLFGDVPFLGP